MIQYATNGSNVMGRRIQRYGQTDPMLWSVLDATAEASNLAVIQYATNGSNLWAVLSML